MSSGERGTGAAASGEKNMNAQGVMNANITSSDVNVLLYQRVMFQVILLL